MRMGITFVSDRKTENLLQDNIRAARVNRGLTQEKAAELIRVSTASIGMYESHRNLPSMSVFIVMCSVYGVSPQDMLGGIIEVKQ